MSLGPRTTSFVGREQSVVELAAAVRAHRLVTVVGAPGVGKTRLAEETGRALEAELDGRVVVRDVSAVVGGDSFVAALGAALDTSSPRTLLIVDGADHLDRTGAEQIARIFGEAAPVHILVTSRRPLRVRGEVLFDLAPLDLPGGDGTDQLEAAAMRLFVERARAEVRTFAITQKTRSDVVAIVRHLDGLPLAIELAAARLRVIGTAELRSGIERGLAVLRSPRSTTARPSLEDALAASWDALSEIERAALARASLFASDFSLEAAAEVLALEGGAEATLDALQALVDRSLVVSAGDGDGDGVRLFRLLQTTRAFAASQAASSDAAARARHAARALRQAAAAASVDELAEVANDLFAVIGRAEQPCDDPGAATVLALEAALALDPLLESRGALESRIELLSRAIALGDRAALGGAAMARTLAARSAANLDLERAVDAGRDLARAGDVAAGAIDPRLEGALASGLARIAWSERRVVDASAAFDVARARFAAGGDVLAEGRTLARLGAAQASLGDAEAACGAYARALEIFRQRREARAEAIALAELAALEADLGMFAVAEARAEAALGAEATVGEPGHEALCLSCLGIVALETGRGDVARQRLERALLLRGQRADTRALAVAKTQLALADELEHPEAAEARYREALELHRAAGDAREEGLVGCALARTAARRGDVEAAYAALLAAEQRLAAAGPGGSAPLAEVARAEIAITAGDREAASRFLAQAGAAPRSSSARIAVRLARARLDAAMNGESPTLAGPAVAPSQLVVARSGRWYRAPGGESVSLSTKRALRLLMKCLADLREQTPGQAAPWTALLEAAWPGERVHPEAGASRVYAAIATLRKGGLRDILVRRDDGYLLDPNVPLARGGDEEPGAEGRKKL